VKWRLLDKESFPQEEEEGKSCGNVEKEYQGERGDLRLRLS
jgi:hypothetical protein